MDVLRVRIGARSSRLSQAQTAIVSGLIKSRFEDGLALEFVPVKTAATSRLRPRSGAPVRPGRRGRSRET